MAKSCWRFKILLCTWKWLNSSAMMDPTGADIFHSQPMPSALYHFGYLGEDSVMSPRFFQYWQLSSVIKVMLTFYLYLLEFFLSDSLYTNAMNKSLKSLPSNFWNCFKFHKHLVAWQWDISLFMNSSNILYKVCIFTSTIINFDIFMSTLKLLSMWNGIELSLIFWSKPKLL